MANIVFIVYVKINVERLSIRKANWDAVSNTSFTFFGNSSPFTSKPAKEVKKGTNVQINVTNAAEKSNLVNYHSNIEETPQKLKFDKLGAPSNISISNTSTATSPLCASPTTLKTVFDNATLESEKGKVSIRADSVDSNNGINKLDGESLETSIEMNAYLLEKLKQNLLSTSSQTFSSNSVDYDDARKKKGEL